MRHVLEFSRCSRAAAWVKVQAWGKKRRLREDGWRKDHDYPKGVWRWYHTGERHPVPAHHVTPVLDALLCGRAPQSLTPAYFGGNVARDPQALWRFRSLLRDRIRAAR